MAGRAGRADATGRYDRIVYLPCTAENDFQPALPDRPVDLIYLCYPNNPTGAVLSRAALAEALGGLRAAPPGAVILYDAAYEAYIRDPDIPHSIFEIEGAREVAIEFRSFSKTAGFTGTRCAFTVVPKELHGPVGGGRAREPERAVAPAAVHQVQRRAVHHPEGRAPPSTPPRGRRQVREAVDFYMDNARIIRDGLVAVGLTVYGARNAPYIWVKTPPGLGSWELFDKLLNEAHVVGTPGAGFGPSGEGYLRLTAFGQRDQTVEAVERIRTRLKL